MSKVKRKIRNRFVFLAKLHNNSTNIAGGITLILKEAISVNKKSTVRKEEYVISYMSMMKKHI